MPGSSDEGGQNYPTRETYKGRQIAISEPQPAAERAAAQGAELPAGVAQDVLVIDVDGRQIEAIQEGPESFYSFAMPYRRYGSPLELARDIVDHVPSLKPGAEQPRTGPPPPRQRRPGPL